MNQYTIKWNQEKVNSERLFLDIDFSLSKESHSGGHLGTIESA